MRLFVSVDLSTLADPIAAVQEPFAEIDGVRPTDPAQAHVTLAFLGDVDRDRRADIESAVGRGVAAADVDPFDCRIGGLGVFPSREYITVVWAGVREGDDALRELHKTARSALESDGVGVDSEDEFVPHVTLGRVENAGAADRVRDHLDRNPDVGVAPVDAVALVRSERGSDGATHTAIREWDL
jgi:2'-5' RNA ligase